MKLVGYADRLSVEPGKTITFMVNSESHRYCADIVQLIHGDSNSAGPGFKIREVATPVSGEHPGKCQRLRPGSYVLVEAPDGLPLCNGFTAHLWIWPTTPTKPLQTLISSVGANQVGFAVRLAHGQLTVQFGDPADVAVLDWQVTARTWYSVYVAYDAQQSELLLGLASPQLTSIPVSVSRVVQVRSAQWKSCSDVLIAAERLTDGAAQKIDHFYNGKIESPTLYSRALSQAEAAQLAASRGFIRDGLIAEWDFSRDVRSARISDISGNGYHGKTINRPTRAVIGHSWDGSEVVWTNATAHYGGIHFHDDDLDDAGWEPSLTWKVPDNTPSAIYALHIHSEGEEDFIPFAVRPKRGAATSTIAFLMPTFSYLAYGNSRTPGRPEVAAQAAITGAPKLPKWPSLPQDKYIVSNRLNSLYDTHTDGSGCCYASWLRPIVTMRPKYLSEITGVRVPHQFNADLHLVDWLTEQGYKFDVIADENLHLEGRKLLDPYRVVLTGTHPEYWSLRMIKACQQYLHYGGRMMYLGGNGMYWVTELDPETGHTIEMRRVQPSAPHFFDPHPGELHLSTSAERAGLWRHRGIPTQAWLGTVMSGAGRTGQHYTRRPDSFDPRVSWIFEGIGREELIGNFPNLHSGYGAVGGEVDRVDFRMEETPRQTLILATSAPFDNTWVWDPVDPPNKPRADIALLEYPNEGGVFSTSSIAWSSCLSYNNYNNNVSRLTRNVLNGLLNRKKILDPSC